MNIQNIKDVCERYRGCAKEYYLDPIPVQKVANSRRRLKLVPDQVVIALIDFTVFGSADESFVVTQDGINWIGLADASPSYIPWAILRQLTYKEATSFLTKNIEFSNGLKLPLAGAPAFIAKNNHTAIQLIDSLQALKGEPLVVSPQENVQNVEPISVEVGGNVIVADDHLHQDIVEVVEVVEFGFLKCEFCQKENKPEVTFCKSCGLKLRG
jgi:hypothetical protein